MKSRDIARIVLLTLPFLGGCYESSAPLGPAEQAVVNPELLGTWTCRGTTKEESAGTLLVVAFDSSRYYLEYRDKEETTRWAAHPSVVGGVLLHNVRELKDDSRATKWVFLRALTPSPSMLLLSVVKDEDLKKLGEPDAHREIRRRVNDESLYQLWRTCART